MSDTDILIELDERRRASLGRVGRAEHRRYLAHEEPDGTIVFVPAVVLTETEMRLYSNPQLLAQIEHSMEHPETWVERGRLKRKNTG